MWLALPMLPWGHNSLLVLVLIELLRASWGNTSRAPSVDVATVRRPEANCSHARQREWVQAEGGGSCRVKQGGYGQVLMASC